MVQWIKSGEVPLVKTFSVTVDGSLSLLKYSSILL